MKTSFIRLIAALAFVLPAAALVASPVMASQSKHHHSAHKTAHKHKKSVTPTAN
ncbi:MAG TPA: hypothetical protein PLD10_06770 [Rhodopila sp.]|nr:hypothetical protein [Rhodopila sp.]